MQEGSNTDHLDSNHVFPGNNGERTSSNNLPYYVAHLAGVREELRGQTEGIEKRLCQEVALLTQQRARLMLHDHQSSRNTYRSLHPSTVVFFVEYDNRNFGVLICRQRPALDDWPQLSLVDFAKIARTCGWVLWELEHTALLQGLRPHAKGTPPVLSKRQQEILELLGRGCDEKAIAQRLGIQVATLRRHKQNIYTNLGVHCESDAILAAYRLHLYSPLEGISPQPGLHLL